MRRARHNLRQGLRSLGALVITAFFLFPVYWLFATSFKQPEEIFSTPPTWFPKSIRFDNYFNMFTGSDIQAIFNSLVIASVSTTLAVLIGTLAAYSLARYRTGGPPLAIWIISLRMIPPVAIAFPLFLLYVELGWVDTYHGLIVVYTALNLPYVIWLMRGFLEDIPRELEESALIDGCSRWQALLRIVFPMARTGMLVTAVFAFIFAMNEFAFAVMLTRVNVITFPVQITSYFAVQSTLWAQIAAISVMGSLPLFVAVLSMQRFLVRGISMGALKG